MKRKNFARRKLARRKVALVNHENRSCPYDSTFEESEVKRLKAIGDKSALKQAQKKLKAVETAKATWQNRVGMEMATLRNRIERHR